MFQTSADILNLSLAASVLVLTFLLAWILWYVIRVLHDVTRVVRQITGLIQKIHDVLDFTKDKISSATALLPLIMKGGQELVEFVKRFRNSDSDEERGRGGTRKHKKKNN